MGAVFDGILAGSARGILSLALAIPYPDAGLDSVLRYNQA
jgi:hypothetical protein